MGVVYTSGACGVIVIIERGRGKIDTQGVSNNVQFTHYYGDT